MTNAESLARQRPIRVDLDQPAIVVLAHPPLQGAQVGTYDPDPLTYGDRLHVDRRCGHPVAPGDGSGDLAAITDVNVLHTQESKAEPGVEGGGRRVHVAISITEELQWKPNG